MAHRLGKYGQAAQDDPLLAVIVFGVCAYLAIELLESASYALAQQPKAHIEIRDEAGRVRSCTIVREQAKGGGVRLLDVMDCRDGRP